MSTTAAAAAPPQSSTTSSSTNQGDGGGSMFEQSAEDAKAKKEELRKLASGDAAAAKKVHPAQLDPAVAAQVEADDSKDPVYNMRQAAKEDYYTPAKTRDDEAEEELTVAATKLLMTDPAEVARVAKEAQKDGDSATSVPNSATSDQPKSEPAPQPYASEPRANQVQPLAATAAAPAASTAAAPTTIRYVPPPVSAVLSIPSASRTPPRSSAPRPVPVDVGATTIQSYSAPTPIHLTIHSDPAEEAKLHKADKEAVQRSAAIAYLQSVHPALPPSPTSSPSLGPRPPLEGAATSLNGLWQPLEPPTLPPPAASPSPPLAVRDAHHDQVYASEERALQTPPMVGQGVKTGPHDQQSYTTSAAVGSAEVAAARSVPVGTTAMGQGVAAGQAGAQSASVVQTQGSKEEPLPLPKVHPDVAQASAARSTMEPVTVVSVPQDGTEWTEKRLEGAAGGAALGAASQRSTTVEPVTVMSVSQDGTEWTQKRLEGASGVVSLGAAAGRSTTVEPVTVLRTSGEGFKYRQSQQSTNANTSASTAASGVSASTSAASAVPPPPIQREETEIEVVTEPPQPLLQPQTQPQPQAQVQAAAASQAKYATGRQVFSSDAAPQIVQVGDASQVRGAGRVLVTSDQYTSSTTSASMQPQVFSSSGGASIVNVSSAAEIPRHATLMALPVQSTAPSTPVTELESTLPAHSAVVLTEEVKAHPSLDEVGEKVHQVQFTTLAGEGGGGHEGVHAHGVKLGQGIVNNSDGAVPTSTA